MADLKGRGNVINNLNKEIAKIKGRNLSGLIKSAVLIRQSMDREPPKVPWDTGNLHASWFTDPRIVGGHPVVRIGFEANYAFFVHEMIGPTISGNEINWNRPGSGPKFLEAALKHNTREILKIIAEESRIR